MKRSWKTLLTLAAVAGLFAAGSASDACFMRSPQPVQVWLDHITINITDQVAVKTYNCTFKNPNPRAVVGGTCYMELEPGAQVDNMSVLIDGKEMKAEILDVDKAKQVFTDIVKNGGSPALLEYFGSQLIQTQVPRIAAGGMVTVKLTYTTVLKKRGGLIRLQMLNTNPKALMQPLKSASVTVNIKSTDPIKNIYSPTHEINIVEKKDWDVSIEWKKEDYLPKHPFVLYYQTADEEVGASLVAHRELDEEGSFMLMLSPTIGQGTGKVTDAKILPKDVVFCIDTSGSMLKDGKMDQARAALKYCVESLRDGDRFNIVDFSTVPRHFQDEGLVKLNDASRAKALRYVAKLHARGGTAINDALELSLQHLRSDGTQKQTAARRLKMIVFATDGLPTIGERNPEAILKKISKQNTEDVRIFVFGEGFDVNTRLLDFLALDHRGEADYILPEENITQKISRFFDRVGSPVMTDLKVSFEGLQVKDVYPPQIPDVFRGEQVILYGRYTGHGEKKIKVTGNVGGETKTFEYTLHFPEYSEDDNSSFVPRLWAGKKVDFLLNEIRKAGPDQMNDELVNEVTYLAKRYGIITPYTSYLMADDLTADSSKPALHFSAGFGRQQIRTKLGAVKAPAADRLERSKRVRDAKQFADYRRRVSKSGAAAALDEAAEALMNEAGRRGSSLEAVRYIGSRTFYKRGKEWQESVYNPAKHKQVRTVEIGSDAYFKLLKRDARIAKFLALGDVVIQLDKTWYRFEKRSRG
jgi:Ca-activated chloride channel family protein